MAKAKVVMTGPTTGKVWVDGVELAHVVAVRFSVDVREKKEHAELEVVQRVIGEIEVEGVMDVTFLDDAGSRVYERAR